MLVILTRSTCISYEQEQSYWSLDMKKGERTSQQVLVVFIFKAI